MNKDFAQKCVRSTSGELINIYIIFEFCAVEDCVNFLKLGRFPGFLLYTKNSQSPYFLSQVVMGKVANLS